MKRESYSWVIQNLPKLVFTVTCFSRKKNTACNTKVFLASYHPSVALATWFSSIVTLPWETFGLKKKKQGNSICFQSKLYKDTISCSSQIKVALLTRKFWGLSRQLLVVFAPAFRYIPYKSRVLK